MFAPGPRAVGFTIVWPEGVIFRSMMTYHVQFLLLVVAGWVSGQQQDVIDYLQEENRVLRAGLRGKPVLSKNTNELKTGAPRRFDRHRPMASPRSGACRKRCRRFGFPVRAGKTASSNGMPRSRAETWTRPGPHLDQNVLARCAAVALASTLDPSGSLFSAPARPGQRPFSYWAQTWHSKIGIRDEYRK